MWFLRFINIRQWTCVQLEVLATACAAVFVMLDAGAPEATLGQHHAWLMRGSGHLESFHQQLRSGRSSASVFQTVQLQERGKDAMGRWGR